MAEKQEKKPDASSAPAPAGGKDGGKGDAKGAKGGGGFLSKTPIMLGGVMILEAVILFAGFKFLGSSPKSASADVEASDHEGDGKDGHGAKKGEGKGDKKTVEIQVVDFRATNKARGQALLFDVSIFVVTKSDHEEKVRKGIKDREALIKDRIGTIIRQSDPEKLGGVQEPGLETLRRQVKYQLDEIIGEGMIEDVLVPRCIPFRAEY